ncbi:MAG: hypothetical protein IJF13_06945 [Clostridia bacterium]|nr:hypothetical protein [Clostridia bacterium]
MRYLRDMKVLHIGKESGGYPVSGLCLEIALLFVTPFISQYLSLLVLAVCIYRMVRYDSKVFATDYCALVSFAPLFRIPGMAMLLVYVFIVAGIWYFIRGRSLKINIVTVFIVLLLFYLITRMDMAFTNFVICFGHMFTLYVLIPRQTTESAVRAAKAFSSGLIVSSVYSLVFRNAHQIVELRGKESPLFWGGSIMRFEGLFGDPNYYMALVLVAIAVLIKLKDSGNIKPVWFWISAVIHIFFGVISYSKTFFVVLVVLVFVYVLWQFRNKKVLYGIFMTLLIVVSANILLFSDWSPFALLLERFFEATNLHEFTTGRSTLWTQYVRTIFSSPITAFFGFGLDAPDLELAAHNIVIEVMYYLGIIGCVLYFGVLISLFSKLIRNRGKVTGRHFIEKYFVILIVAILHMSLHGMFQVIFYANVFIGILSCLIVPLDNDGGDPTVTQEIN